MPQTSSIVCCGAILQKSHAHVALQIWKQVLSCSLLMEIFRHIADELTDDVPKSAVSLCIECRALLRTNLLGHFL